MAINKGMSDAASMMDEFRNQPDMSSENENTNDPKMLVDSALARAQSYMENPRMVTPETLTALVKDLQKLSTVLGGENVPSRDVVGSSTE